MRNGKNKGDRRYGRGIHSEKGFNKVYDLLKVNFTETKGQSHFSEKGKSVVLEALKKGIAKREEDGAVYVQLDVDEKNPMKRKKYILRSNQTASYITQDLGAAVERFKEYKFEKMIYVVDFRQSDHFDNLFKILKMLGYPFTDRCYHLAFGTINFGKEIMATRTGKIILLEEVLQKTIKKADEEIKKRKTKGDSEKVGVGAIKYVVLKNEPIKDVNFSWDLLNFEGNTGPYSQYAYARASSILRKADKQHLIKKITIIPELTSYEISLVTTISRFPEEVINAEKLMNPGIIANYAYSLAKSFNDFYHNCPVLTAENEKIKVFRLKLIDSFRTTLKNALHLLGIDVMDEM
ncbi:arginine--tRNA ligase [Candidatus Pacearchaeota archaeon]|nr:arginine--tRNA ligase [Candidatus Pacearchaeota archaeon]